MPEVELAVSGRGAVAVALLHCLLRVSVSPCLSLSAKDSSPPVVTSGLASPQCISRRAGGYRMMLIPATRAAAAPKNKLISATCENTATTRVIELASKTTTPRRYIGSTEDRETARDYANVDLNRSTFASGFEESHHMPGRIFGIHQYM